MPSTPIIDLDELVSQAGQATYQKGVLLFKTKKVSHLQRQGDVITATVQGHRHLHKLAQTLYTLTKISTGYLGQPL